MTFTACCFSVDDWQFYFWYMFYVACIERRCLILIGMPSSYFICLAPNQDEMFSNHNYHATSQTMRVNGINDAWIPCSHACCTLIYLVNNKTLIPCMKVTWNGDKSGHSPCTSSGAEQAWCHYKYMLFGSTKVTFHVDYCIDIVFIPTMERDIRWVVMYTCTTASKTRVCHRSI